MKKSKFIVTLTLTVESPDKPPSKKAVKDWLTMALDGSTSAIGDGSSTMVNLRVREVDLE